MLLLFLLCNIIQFDSPCSFPIEYLQIRGLVRTPSIKPYELSAVLQEIDTLLLLEDRLNTIDRKFLSTFAPFLKKPSAFYTHLNLGMKNDNFDDVYGIFDYQIAGQMTKNISFAHGIRFKAGSKIDSSGPQPWKDFVQAYLYEGYLKVSNRRIDFLIGRRNLLFGYDDKYSLLLAPDNEGYDGYLFSYSGQYYEFQSSLSLLNANSMRFLSIHRIALDMKYLKLGFSEAILWGGAIEPIYLNFLIPYYLSQWGLYRNDNIMWRLDCMISMLSSVFYGEFLIDDYQFSEPPPDYTEYPHKLALQIGFKKIWNNYLYLGVKYAFVDKWVYTHYLPVNVYEKDGVPLGFALGNDVDNLVLNIKFLNSMAIIPGIELESTRKGEGSIFLPYEVERGPAYPEFPSGIVETRLKLIGTLEFHIKSCAYLSLEAGRIYRKNIGHNSGINDHENTLSSRIWFVF